MLKRLESAPEKAGDDTRIEQLLSDHGSPMGADRKYFDTEFLIDMQDLFAGRREGHAFHHVMTGRAFELWEEFTRAADSEYYPFKDEAYLIKSNPDWFRIMAGLEFGEGSIVVELGTGSAYSAQQKTIPLLENVNGVVYVGDDKSLSSAQAVTEEVRQARPQTSTLIRINDFNRQNLHVEWSELNNPIVRDWERQELIKPNPLPEVEPRVRIFVQFGCTLGNLEGFIDSEPPMEKVVACLKNYRANMHFGDTLFLGLDHNQHEDSLHACYGSPIIAKFSMAMLQSVKDNLPVEGFEPDNFEYTRMWNKKNGLYFHGFNTKAANTFSLGGEKMSMPSNGKRSYVNGWKLKQKFWEEAFKASDLRHKGVLAGPNNFIHIHALEAA